LFEDYEKITILHSICNNSELVLKLNIFFLETFKNYCKFLVISIFLLFVAACDNNIYISNSVYWKNNSFVNASKGYIDIVVSGATGVKWNASIDEGSEWCTFGSNETLLTEVSGFITSGENYFRIYHQTNYSPAGREAKITFRFENEDEQVLTLKQMPAYTAFTETPQKTDDEQFQYVTHYTTLKSKAVRNYSICFDKSRKAALWVAYPLHPAYLGSVSRTDEWGYDPLIYFQHQPDCVFNSYGGSYDRGHQLPSADRLATREMNVQTFYMSNMTPQYNRLNQDMWAKLEMKVRANNCSDTLFVVTGAWFESDSKTTTDGVGARVPVPTHYYKVLLRTVSGSSGKSIAKCSDNEIKTIGFWVEHRSYGDIEPPRSICVSVSEIEAKTGLKFFPGVSEVVKKQNNPSQWGL
jgi:endonuclease G